MHLGIDLREYDARIRTFIPDYGEMLGVAAAATPARTRTIVDLYTTMLLGVVLVFQMPTVVFFLANRGTR